MLDLVELPHPNRFLHLRFVFVLPCRFKMEKLIAFVLLLVAVPYSELVTGETTSPNIRDPNTHLAMLRSAGANVGFAMRLFRQIASQPGTASKNIFFSPLSISAALSMLSLGARQNTLAELMQVLGYNEMEHNGERAVRELFQYLLEELTSENSTLKIGNSLHIQEGLNVKRMFLQESKQFYNADIKNINFQEPQNAKEQINTYLKNKTNGKIPEFVKEPLPRDTVMLLLNYIFFKGNWLKPFDIHNTYEADFHVDDGTTVKVQMMKRMGMFESLYANVLSSHIIKIPYQRNTSLLLILPDPGKLAEVGQKMTLSNFQPLLQLLGWRSAELHLPKLSLRTSYQLNNLLRAMGLNDAFTNHANFSGISETPLKVSKVVHEAVLDIDEKGTEASAVTGIEIMPMSMPMQLKFNRPFLLLIVEHNVKNVLFAGRVMNPAA
ncbi:alpha-1-antitrypsin-like isoform X1 [Rhinoraja longicauda]